jgi:hypothetical protein
MNINAGRFEKNRPVFYFVALYERDSRKRSPLKALGYLTPAEFEAQWLAQQGEVTVQ